MLRVLLDLVALLVNVVSGEKWDLMDPVVLLDPEALLAHKVPWESQEIQDLPAKREPRVCQDIAVWQVCLDLRVPMENLAELDLVDLLDLEAWTEHVGRWDLTASQVQRDRADLLEQEDLLERMAAGVVLEILVHVVCLVALVGPRMLVP